MNRIGQAIGRWLPKRESAPASDISYRLIATLSAIQKIVYDRFPQDVDAKSAVQTALLSLSSRSQEDLIELAQKVSKVFDALQESPDKMHPLIYDLNECSFHPLDGIVAMEYDNLGGIIQRECQYVEDHLKEVQKLFTTRDEACSDAICGIDDKDRYFQEVDAFKGKVDVLPSLHVCELLSGIYLNIPSDVEVHLGDQSCLLYGQPYVDIYRVNRITIDDKIIFPLIKPSLLGTPEQVFSSCLASFDDNLQLTNQATKLLTQATLARPFEVLNNLFTNSHLSIIVASAGNVSLSISTKADLLVFRYFVFFKLYDLAEEKAIKYLRVIREIRIDKESLQRGSGKDAKICDFYSPFYDDLESTMSAPFITEQYRDCAIV